MQRDGQQHDRQDGLRTEMADNGLGDQTEAQAHTVHRVTGYVHSKDDQTSAHDDAYPQGTEIFGVVGCSSRSGGVSPSGRMGQGAGQKCHNRASRSDYEERNRDVGRCEQ